MLSRKAKRTIEAQRQHHKHLNSLKQSSTLLTPSTLEATSNYEFNQPTESNIRLEHAVDAHQYAAALNEYTEKYSTVELLALQAVRQDTNDLFPGGMRMLSGNLQCQFLSLLIGLHKPKKILELGTFTGYSSLAMAFALRNNDNSAVVTPDSSLPRIITCETDHRVAEIASKHLSLNEVQSLASIRDI